MKIPNKVFHIWDRNQKNPAWFFYDIPNGMNNAIYKNSNLECIFAYKKQGDHIILAIKTPSSGYRAYMFCREFFKGKRIKVSNFFKNYPEKSLTYIDRPEYEKAKVKVFSEAL